MVRNRAASLTSPLQRGQSGSLGGEGSAGTPTRRDALRLLSAGHEIVHLSAHTREIRSEADEHRCGHAFTLPHQTQEHVLGADVAVVQLQRLAQREFQDLLGPGRKMRGPTGDGQGHPDRLPDLVTDRLEGDPERPESLGPYSLFFANQAEEDVLGTDERVVELARFLLRQGQHSPRPLGEALEHGSKGIAPAADRTGRPAGRALLTPIRIVSGGEGDPSDPRSSACRRAPLQCQPG